MGFKKFRIDWLLELRRLYKLLIIIFYCKWYTKQFVNQAKTYYWTLYYITEEGNPMIYFVKITKFSAIQNTFNDFFSLTLITNTFFFLSKLHSIFIRLPKIKQFPRNELRFTSFFYIYKYTYLYFFNKSQWKKNRSVETIF